MRGTKRSHHQSNMSSSSSYDLNNVWKKACWKAMGYDDDDWDDDVNEVTGTSTTTNSDNDYNNDNNTKSNNNENLTSWDIMNLVYESITDSLKKNHNHHNDKGDNDHYTKKSNNIHKVQLDPFMKMVLQIQNNIQQMEYWLHSKEYIYIQIITSDQEASLIQSTITSFTATTMNEIESLNQFIGTTVNNSSTINNNTNNNNANNYTQKQQHYIGIIQILMIQLQDTIAEPFKKLNSLRQQRMNAIQIYQNPIQCKLYTTSKQQKSKKVKSNHEKDTTLELLGFDDDDDDEDDTDDGVFSLKSTNIIDQRFIPTRPTHQLHHNFWSSYEQSKHIVDDHTIVRPKSIFVSINDPNNDNKTNETISTTKPTVQSIVNKTADKSAATAMKHIKVNDQIEKSKVSQNVYHDNTDSNASESDMATLLQQESLVLQQRTQNHHDLDSVQHMEQTMMNITNLLSQFTNLIVEQQENIIDIYDTTITTKDNIEQGTENLYQAKDRVQSSKHYMASMITFLSISLLIIHWLRP